MAPTPLPYSPQPPDQFACIPVPSLEFYRLRLPVGIELRSFDLIELMQPALAPLVPFFRILRIILAIVNVIETIPEAITQLQVNQLIAALLILADELGILAELAPAISLVLTVVDILDQFVVILEDAKFAINKLKNQLARIDAAREAALDVDITLLDIINCSLEDLFLELDNVWVRLQALGALIEVTNLFLGLVQVPEEYRIPSFSELAGTQLEDAVEAIDDVIEPIKLVRSFVPLP